MNEQEYNYINKCFNELRKELKQEQINQLDLIKGLRKDVTKLQQGHNIPKEAYIFIIYIIVILSMLIISYKLMTRGIY